MPNPIALDDNGNPIFDALDDNGNPIQSFTVKPIQAPEKESFIKGSLRRLAFGPSVEDLNKVDTSHPINKKLGSPESEGSILPKFDQPETYWGGFLNSIYNDFIRPLGSPSGALGTASLERLPIPKGPEPITNPARLLLAENPSLPPSPLKRVFVGGPEGNPLGQVSHVPPSGNVGPKTASIISGEAIHDVGKPIIPPAVDLGELAEQNRLRDVYFTKHEYEGGTSLDLPDREYLPARAGETRGGFNPSSQADLPYPLNIAPEGVRPRSIQTELLARTPRSATKPTQYLNDAGELVAGEHPETFTLKGKDKPYYSGTGQALPGQEVLPSARELRIAEENTKTPLGKVAVSNELPPEINQAAAKLIKEESKSPSSWKSVYTQLKELSPELYAKSFKRVHQARQYLSAWIPELHNAGQKLSAQELKDFGGYVEGSIPITNPKVQEAVNIWKAVADSMGTEASTNWAEYGPLRMLTGSKKSIPFQKNPNYWPHIPVESAETLKDKLIKQGMSLFEANKIINSYKREGELVSSFQHARMKNVQVPYRMDFDAGMAHIRAMADRIAKHRNFGPEDVGGFKNEGIADLINSTKDKELTNTLMQRVVGRETDKINPTLNKALDYSRKWATYTKLQNFTIPNIILGQTTTGLKSLGRHPLVTIGEVSKLLSPTYRKAMKSSGVWQDFAHSLAEEIKPGIDVYGIGAGEAINRGIAGAAGKAVAKAYFNDLKSNPGNKRAANELFELLGEEPAKLIGQDALTNDQLNMAAGRMAEKTQGLNVPGNLPLWASNPVKDFPNFAGQLFLTFKKIGYQQTKNVWESIKNDPVRTLPLWMALAQIGGELTGDVKQGIRGAFTNTSGERIENRGSFWLKEGGITEDSVKKVAELSGVSEETIARIVDNYMQSFFLGLPADMLMSDSGPMGFASSIVGPVVGDISKAVNYARKGGKGLGKELMKNLPIPGSSGLVDAFSGQ